MVPFDSLKRMYLGGFFSRILIAFLMLLIFATTMATNINGNSDDDFVPEDQWVCGATAWDNTLAYQRANESCRDVGWGINNCCAIHDTCYIQDKSQEECDQPFCECLAEQARLSGNSECGAATDGFCFIVQIFGGIAHSNAKERMNNTEANLTEVIALTTTTTTTTTTPAPTTTSTTEGPLKKAHRLEPTEEECFSPELNNCITEFETCQSTNQLELLQCEERMCQCTRANLRYQAEPECRFPIEVACRIPDSVPLRDSNNEDDSFLTTKVVIFGFSTTVLSISVMCVLAMFPISIAIWAFYRNIKKPSMPVSASQTPLCAASSTDSGLGCGSNETLSSDDGVRLALYP